MSWADDKWDVLCDMDPIALADWARRFEGLLADAHGALNAVLDDHLYGRHPMGADANMATIDVLGRMDTIFVAVNALKGYDTGGNE